MKQLVAKTITPFTGHHGFYSSCTVNNVDEFLSFLHQIGLTTNQIAEFHATVIYAPMEAGLPLSASQILQLQSTRLVTAIVTGIELFGPNKDTVVLTLNSPDLAELNRKWQSAGMVSTYPVYRPHITILKDTPVAETTLERAASAIQCTEMLKLRLSSEVLEDIS